MKTSMVDDPIVSVELARAAKIRTALLHTEDARVTCEWRTEHDAYVVRGPFSALYAMMLRTYPEHANEAFYNDVWTVTKYGDVSTASRTLSKTCEVCGQPLVVRYVLGNSEPTYTCDGFDGRCAMSKAVLRFSGGWDPEGAGTVHVNVRVHSRGTYTVRLVCDGLNTNAEEPATVWLDGNIIGYVDDVLTLTIDELCELVRKAIS